MLGPRPYECLRAGSACEVRRRLSAVRLSAVRRGAMKRSEGRILTTHVGSLPRPQDLAGMLMGGAQTGTAEQQAAFRARTASAVAEAVRKQVDAGVDVVSDGEQGKIGFVNYVKDRLDGFGGQATPFMAADMLDFQTTATSGSATAIAQAQRENPGA